MIEALFLQGALFDRGKVPVYLGVYRVTYHLGDYLLLTQFGNVVPVDGLLQ